MPQMSPMPWMFIFAMVILCLHLMSSTIYFQLKMKLYFSKNSVLFSKHIKW